MSKELVQQLVRRALEDADFRQRLEATPVSDRRALLEEEGYGDIQLHHVAQMLPRSSGGELSDEDFAAVVGAVGTSTMNSAAVSAGATAVGTFTVTIGVALAAG